jgi:hypothetical protein
VLQWYHNKRKELCRLAVGLSVSRSGASAAALCAYLRNYTKCLFCLFRGGARRCEDLNGNATARRRAITFYRRESYKTSIL